MQIKKRIACLDYGLKRIGFAISDENQRLATALGNIQAGKSPMQTIDNILNAMKIYELEMLIIGNPIHLNGKASPLSDEVSAFAKLLQERVDYPISLFDERLSTLQAERLLQETGMKRKKRSKMIDGLSAVIILQSYLDSNT